MKQSLNYNNNNKCYIKTVIKSKDLFQKLNAWGVEKSVVDKLSKKECKTIQIYDKEENTLYWISFVAFKSYSTNEEVDKKSQMFLPIHYWMKKEKYNND